MMGVFFGWHGDRSVSTDVLITSHLQASSVLTGQQGANTCDLVMISSIANRSDVQQCAAVLHIHYTIPCINRSMGMHASICIETMRMCHTSVTLQNNQTAQSSPGSVKTVDGGKTMTPQVLSAYIHFDVQLCVCVCVCEGGGGGGKM